MKKCVILIVLAVLAVLVVLLRRERIGGDLNFNQRAHGYRLYHLVEPMQPCG
jgi:hypothetical protein